MILARRWGLSLREFEARFVSEDLEWLVALDGIVPLEDEWMMSANLLSWLANYTRAKGSPALDATDVYSFLGEGNQEPRDTSRLDEAKWHAYAISHNASLKKD